MTDDEKPRTHRPSLARRAAEAIRGHRGEMPGPFGRSFWRSPIRGPWLTSVLGLILLAGVPVVFVTGLLSYAAYNPDLARINDTTPGKGLLGFYLFSWPTHPVWLYRVNQGLHVTLGLVLIPILLAKLWSVLPKLFEWPPVRSPAHALERLSLLLLVGGAVFEFITGVLNIQQWYKFPGSFYTLHFYGAWVFVAGLVVHVLPEGPDRVQGAAQRRPDPGAARRYRPHAAGIAGRLRAGQPGARRPDDLPARRAGLRRGRLAPGAGPVGRAVAGRPAAPHRAAGPARAGSRHRPQRLPDQPDRGPGGRQRGRDRRELAAHPWPGRRDRSPAPAPEPGRAARDGAAHRAPADRLRRGLVHRQPGLDRSAAA